MSLILLVHSYGGANEAVARHWPYFLNAQADRIVGIGTEVGDCVFPDGVEQVRIGDGLYLNGRNLPTRLMQTIAYFMEQPEYWCAIAEYDVLFCTDKAFGQIPDDTSKEPLAFCHLTGGKTWDAEANWFAHCPWVMNKPAAVALLPVMGAVLVSGLCEYGKAESSPDVFWGLCCERAGITVVHNFWREFTRNSFDIPGDLELARQAYRDGVDVIHGCKTAEQLAFITT